MLCFFLKSTQVERSIKQKWAPHPSSTVVVCFSKLTNLLVRWFNAGVIHKCLSPYLISDIQWCSFASRRIIVKQRKNSSRLAVGTPPKISLKIALAWVFVATRRSTDAARSEPVSRIDEDYFISKLLIARDAFRWNRRSRGLLLLICDQSVFHLWSRLRSISQLITPRQPQSRHSARHNFRLYGDIENCIQLHFFNLGILVGLLSVTLENNSHDWVRWTTIHSYC